MHIILMVCNSSIHSFMNYHPLVPNT